MIDTRFIKVNKITPVEELMWIYVRADNIVAVHSYPTHSSPTCTIGLQYGNDICVEHSAEEVMEMIERASYINEEKPNPDIKPPEYALVSEGYKND